MPNPSPSAREFYQTKVERLESQLAQQNQLATRLVWIRLGTAIPGLLLLFVGMVDSHVSHWLWKIGALFLVLFLGAATWYENNGWMIRRLQQQLILLRRRIARCDRNWERLVALQSESCCESFESELSRDLDLFGERSLYRWFSAATTHSGAQTICHWMVDWAAPQEVRERQHAVQELVAQPTWCESFQDTSLAYTDTQSNPEKIAEWCSTDSLFQRRKWVWMLTWVGPILIPIGLATTLLGKLHESNVEMYSGLGLMALGIVLNFLMTMTVVGPIHDIFLAIGRANRELQSLVSMLIDVEDIPGQSDLLVRIREMCRRDGVRASNRVMQLRRWMFLAGFQQSPLFFVPYLVLQITVLWDVRILEQLERWKRQHGHSAEDWLQAIGISEALVSSASIASENPDWCFPEWNDTKDAANPTTLSIHRISHPLLKDSMRVPNDLEMHRDKPLLLITGSNMAGKSTMLRSVGVNVILARLGAPVCAISWRSELFEVASSIRVQDSLQDGVSFFMAELKRLRNVIDRSGEVRLQGRRPMLVLLDEILQGTNSRERQIAVERVLRKLVDHGCTVLTSTHDLELANQDLIVRSAQIVHFREYFEAVDGQQVMKFDYKMREGVTPTTNALKLLEFVGIQ